MIHFEMEKKNIEDLSNLVFGLALTLGALTLVQPSTGSFSELFNILLGFALSFVVVVWFWWVYNSAMKHVRMESRSMFALNIVLLFLVVIEPYLLTTAGSISGSTAYALDLGTTMLVFVLLFQSIVNETSVSDHKMIRWFRRSRNISMTTTLIFYSSAIVGLLPFSASSVLQKLMWLGALLFSFSSRLVSSRLAQKR